MAVYTDYNELMHLALKIANERGVTQQKDFNLIIMEVFQANPRKK